MCQRFGEIMMLPRGEVESFKGGRGESFRKSETKF